MKLSSINNLLKFFGLVLVIQVSDEDEPTVFRVMTIKKYNELYFGDPNVN